MTSTASKCYECGKEGRYICTVCHRMFCAINGCSFSGSLHPGRPIQPLIEARDADSSAGKWFTPGDAWDEARRSNW